MLRAHSKIKKHLYLYEVKGFDMLCVENANVTQR
jgi:hypothetical protein